MIRATTGGVMKTYRSNLMNSFIKQSNAMNTILTQRNFNSFAEDPAAAAKAFRLRKSRMMVNSQHQICTDTYKKYQTAQAALQSMNNQLQNKNGEYGMYMRTIKGTTLSMLNDPEGDAREQLSKVLDQMSELLVQDLNQKYGDNFIFAGADGRNVPFEVKLAGDGTKHLYYRGVSVDTTMPNIMQDSTGKPLEITTNADGSIVSQGGGTYIKMDTSALIDKDKFDQIVIDDPTAAQPSILYADGDSNPKRFNEKGEVDPNGQYYLNMDKAETMTVKEYEAEKQAAEKLEYLANEKCFVDIGLGFQENEKGQLIEASAFNAALNGINFIGYGLDEDGDPKNLYSLVQRLTEISDSVPESGKWSEDVYNEFDRLVGKLETAASHFTTEFVNLDAGVTKLENNAELLEGNFDNLYEQYADLEDVDMVESICSFLWAQYAYNSALKVGNSILSQSLMDFLN